MEPDFGQLVTKSTSSEYQVKIFLECTHIFTSKLNTLMNFKEIGPAAYQSTGSSVLSSYGKQKIKYIC